MILDVGSPIWVFGEWIPDGKIRIPGVGKVGLQMRIDNSIFPGMVWGFGFRNKHFEDGEPCSRRVFEFSSSEQALSFVDQGRVLPLDSYMATEHTGDIVLAPQF